MCARARPTASMSISRPPTLMVSLRANACRSKRRRSGLPSQRLRISGLTIGLAAPVPRSGAGPSRRCPPSRRRATATTTMMMPRLSPPQPSRQVGGASSPQRRPRQQRRRLHLLLHQLRRNQLVRLQLIRSKHLHRLLHQPNRRRQNHLSSSSQHRLTSSQP